MVVWNNWKVVALVQLSSRHQLVSLNNQSSSTLPVISGVPQGSILGPLLFLIFVNDIPSYISSSSVLMYADDTKCFKSINSATDSACLQVDLESLSKWSIEWHLSFNIQKCNLLRISTSKSPSLFDYVIDRSTINQKINHKDLGVIFCHDLTWSTHISYIISKAYKTLGLVRRTFSHCSSINAKKLLYISLVRSILTFSSQVWRPYLKKDIIALEKVQRRATKFILNDFSSDYKTRLQQLQLLPLMMTLELNDIIFTVNALKHPADHFNILDFISMPSSCTRSSNKFKLCHTYSSTSKSKHLFFSRIPRLWNSLPSIDISRPVSVTKHELKKFFHNHFLTYFDSNNSCTFHFLCPCCSCSSTPSSSNYQQLSGY